MKPRVYSLEWALHGQREGEVSTYSITGAGAAQVPAGDGATETITEVGAAWATAGDEATYLITGAGVPHG